MQCKNCGANLVRGFTFCLECGMPVPPEALEESGLPQRNIDSGVQEAFGTSNADQSTQEDVQVENTGDVKPQMQGLADERSGKDIKPQYLAGDAGVGGKDLKPKYVGFGEEASGAALKAKPIGGEEQSVGGANVRATMQESSSSSLDSSVEKLVFCSNCGMRMQHNQNVCEKCGMPLGNKPNNTLSQSNGIPLFNNDADPFGDQFGGFGGQLSGISDADAARIDNFMNGMGGGLDPMFNSVDVPLNVNASPNDFAQLNEQLANFSAASGMPTIETVESTYVRQKEPKKGEEREMVDFQLNDDLSTEPLEMSLKSIRVVDDYSMDENPAADIDLDPYKFLGNSMDEIDAVPQAQQNTVSKPSIEPIAPPAPVPTPASESKAEEPIQPRLEKAEAIKAEGVSKDKDAPKAEKVSKVEEVPKAEDTPKAEKVSKVEEVPKVEEAPKAEKVSKVEEVPKAEDAPKAEKVSKVEEASKAEEASKTEEVPKIKRSSKTEEDFVEEAPFIMETAPFIAEFSAQGYGQTNSAPSAPSEPKSKGEQPNVPREPKVQGEQPTVPSSAPNAPAAAVAPYAPYVPQDQGVMQAAPVEQVPYIPSFAPAPNKKRTAIIIAIILAVIAFVVVVVILGVNAGAADVGLSELTQAASGAPQDNAEHIMSEFFG